MHELQVGVKAIVKNSDGKYLLLLRSEEKYPGMGHVWDIVGGRINPGIGLHENLVREIKEEIDLDLTGEPQLIAAQDIFASPTRHVVRLTYVVTLDGDPHLNGEEHTEYRWVTFEEMKQLQGLDSHVKQLIEEKVFS